jgi:hypothetical protein
MKVNDEDKSPHHRLKLNQKLFNFRNRAHNKEKSERKVITLLPCKVRAKGRGEKWENKGRKSENKNVVEREPPGVEPAA